MFDRLVIEFQNFQIGLVRRLRNIIHFVTVKSRLVTDVFTSAGIIRRNGSVVGWVGATQLIGQYGPGCGRIFTVTFQNCLSTHETVLLENRVWSDTERQSITEGQVEWTTRFYYDLNRRVLTVSVVYQFPSLNLNGEVSRQIGVDENGLRVDEESSDVGVKPDVFRRFLQLWKLNEEGADDLIGNDVKDGEGLIVKYSLAFFVVCGAADWSVSFLYGLGDVDNDPGTLNRECSLERFTAAEQ